MTPEIEDLKQNLLESVGCYEFCWILCFSVEFESNNIMSTLQSLKKSPQGYLNVSFLPGCV